MCLYIAMGKIFKLVIVHFLISDSVSTQNFTLENVVL